MAQDPYRYFRIEAREILEQLAAGVLALEKSGGEEAVLHLLRLAHTIKGAARIVKQRDMADVAHKIEECLGPLRGTEVLPARHDDVLALVDRMTELVAQIPPPPGAEPAASTTTAAAPITRSIPRVDDIPALPHADTQALDELIGGLGDIHAQIHRLRSTPSLETLGPRVDRLDRELAQLRLDAERLRLMPAGSVFGALERTARDATLVGKRVAFTSQGADMRVDAEVLTRVFGALVQLVRNAVAHGIETPAARIAAGKPAEGSIAVSVKLHGTRAMFSCTDDGAGIDLAAVRRAATSRDAAAATFDDNQLLAMLMRGGISTSTSVTELSGRGIGLDVVREAAIRLGGEVTARSTPGQGTTIAISAPVSLASLSAMMVEAGGHVAAIPLHAILRIERIAPSSIVRTGDGLAIAYDDLTIAYDTLARILGATSRGAHGNTTVIIDAGGALAAIAVDQLHGVADIVVRTPPDAPIDPIVLGVMLDADGLPRPVLDPAAVVSAAVRARVAPSNPDAERAPILVIDDSLTTRMLEQSILESAGYIVDTASSAEEGLDKASQRKYALFLVDVEMPGMDGFQFVTEIRRRPALASIPTIMVTSRASPEDRKRGADAGIDGFMAKGQFDQVELLAMIERLVQR